MRKTWLYQWLYHHPYALCWFCIAYLIGFGVYDVATHRWFAACNTAFCMLFLGWVIWRGKRRMRKIDAEIERMEAEATERLARMRADRAARHRHTPEGP